ncbi:MAG: DoxX family protein [Acidimicrobiales bacterium]
MLSSVFVYGGVDAIRNPNGKGSLAEPVAGPIARQVPGLTEDPEKLVVINGAIQVCAGLALATGKFRRLAALALIGSAVPTTTAGHRFWEETDEARRHQQRVQFCKNLGVIGGLLLSLVDTEGKPSMAWRAKRRACGARNRAAELAGGTVQAGSEMAGAMLSAVAERLPIGA